MINEKDASKREREYYANMQWEVEMYNKITILTSQSMTLPSLGMK